MKNVLVTGGAGFIGSHLAEHLLTKGFHVSVIDDLSTGSLDNLASCKLYPNFRQYNDTIFNDQLMPELVAWADIIVHLAAAVGVQLVTEKPLYTLETNVKGTERILNLASGENKLVMIASTSEVYGKNPKSPYEEDDDIVLGATTRGRWGYACSKALDEFLALAYWQERKTPVIITRFFNTVGPRQSARYGMVIPRFVQQALADEPITIFGSGEQSRTFTHITDVTHALSQLLVCPQAVGHIFNVGGKEEVTISQLAEKTKGLLRSDSPIVYIPYEEAYNQNFEDMMRRVPSIAKLQRYIAYEPQRTIDDIILDVANFYRQTSESIAPYQVANATS